MLASQETCPHCGLVSVTDSPYANRSGNAVQYTANTAGPQNVTSIAWALPLACASLVLMFYGGKGAYFAMLKSGQLGKPVVRPMGMAAYDGLMWYFQLPISLVLLLVGIAILVACWKAVFD